MDSARKDIIYWWLDETYEGNHLYYKSNDQSYKTFCAGV